MTRISYQDVPADLLEGMKKSQEYIDNCGIDHRLLELMRFRVSQINSCAYCLDMHYKEAIHNGETALRLLSVSAWREAPYYSPAEQAVLAFAERLTRMREEEESENIHEQLSAHFTKKEIAQLTLAVTQINSWNRLVRSFGQEPGKYKVRDKVAAS